MKSFLITFLFTILISSYATACINSYTIELIPQQFDSAQARIDYYQQELKDFQSKHRQINSAQLKNDYAVLLILTDQYPQAIKTLQSLERDHPNLPKTAVNLGTAYELMGDYLKARKWIRMGMQRDPHIHEGSEWIHMNILNAKQNHADVKWLNENPLLDLTFGTAYFPQPNHIQHETVDQAQLELIREQAKLQIEERRKFVFHNDPIIARVYYDLANIEQSLSLGSWLSRMQDNAEVSDLIRFAQSLGLQQDAVVTKRIRVIESNPFERLWMQIHDYFAAVFSTDK